MWTRSLAVAMALRESHTRLCRVDVLQGGRPVRTLMVKDGTMTSEARRPVTRNLSAGLRDDTGELIGGTVDDLLNPYDCELAVWRGVRLPTGDVYAPMGVFRLTGRAVPGDGVVNVTAQDRAIIYQGPMTNSMAIGAGTPVEQAIVRLLGTRNSRVQMTMWKTGRTVGPLVFEPDIDVWREAQDLARSVGGWLSHDRQGFLGFRPALPTTVAPVIGYRYGDGKLLDVDRSEDSDTIHNVVVVESSKTGNGGIIRAVVKDNNPRSKTYAGRYQWPITIKNQHVGSLEQAQQVGATELARQLGRSETMQVQVVPDPWLDPLDIVGLHSPRHGLYERRPVIESISCPLTSGTMTLGLRRALLGTSGQVYDVPEDVMS